MTMDADDVEMGDVADGLDVAGAVDAGLVGVTTSPMVCPYSL